MLRRLTTFAILAAATLGLAAPAAAQDFPARPIRWRPLATDGGVSI